MSQEINSSIYVYTRYLSPSQPPKKRKKKKKKSQVFVKYMELGMFLRDQ